MAHDLSANASRHRSMTYLSLASGMNLNERIARPGGEAEGAMHSYYILVLYVRAVMHVIQVCTSAKSGRSVGAYCVQSIPAQTSERAALSGVGYSESLRM